MLKYFQLYKQNIFLFYELEREYGEKKMKAVLFDLDGTLLPMDMDVFTRTYFGYLCKKVAPYGYEAKELIEQVWKGTAAMVQNDGSKTNEEAFWSCFLAHYGAEHAEDQRLFDEFYRNEFANAQQVCGKNPLVPQVIRWLKEHGIRIILATNPIFPEIATLQRIQWAGLEPEDFELITVYENCNFAKPNPDYYRDVLARCGLREDEVVMVGNDVCEDMIACEKAGIEGFLITDTMVNKNAIDITQFPHGDFHDLLAYLERKL